MTRYVLTAACTAALAFAYGCGSTEENERVATALEVNPAALALAEGETVQITVMATYDDGSAAEVTGDVLYTVAGAAVSVDAGAVVGRAAGDATITATLGDVSGTATATVSEAPITGLTVEAAGPLEVGGTTQLHAVGAWDSGVRSPLLAGVTWSSSNPEVATVDAAGLATIVGRGSVTFTAQARGQEGRFSPSIDCEYPRFSPQLQYDRVVPNLSWPAKWPDGTAFDMRFANVHCNAAWEQTKTLAVVLSAGWCTPCTLYAQRLEGEIANLNALGMEVMIIEVEDKQGNLADLDFAYTHLDNITRAIPGIAAGDLDTTRIATNGSEPIPGFLAESAILRAFPSVFVVRTRDMKIIADQNRANSYLPLAQIAQDPEADWSNTTPVFRSQCAAGDEEASEPNDKPADAAVVTAGTYPGGICADGPDMYKVDIAGDWTATLTFEHSVGDLDLFVWEEARNQPAQDAEGRVVGSATSNDVETFTFRGPAVIAIQGYQAASAPYTLTISE